MAECRCGLPDADGTRQLHPQQAVWLGCHNWWVLPRWWVGGQQGWRHCGAKPLMPASSFPVQHVPQRDCGLSGITVSLLWALVTLGHLHPQLWWRQQQPAPRLPGGARRGALW